MRVCFVEAIGITLRMYYCEFSSLPPESTLRAMEITLAVTQAAVKHGYSPLKDEQLENMYRERAIMSSSYGNCC